MRVLHGRQSWCIGDQINGGGIGTIHEAWPEGSDVHDAYVAKLVPVEPGADREFLLAEVADARNVVPVVDSSTVDGNYVLVMPRARRSLQNLLDERGKLDVAEAVRVATDVAATLTDLDGRVVHRDLKPGNVLSLGEAWCLTDFGISRYAEAATSPATRKFWMSAPYAAPEQWRHEHATSAADVYALGIVLFQMLAGRWPFPGPRQEDFQAQHLYADPPELPGLRDDLQTLIVECLTKAPQARPAPRRVLDRLERLDLPPPASLRALRAGSLRHARDRAVAARDDAVRITDRRRRAELLRAARRSFDRLGTALFAAVSAAAPNADSEHTDHSWRFGLGETELSQGDLVAAEADPWGEEPDPGFDVIATAEIRIRHRGGAMSHSLWYCDWPAPGRYGWAEFAFTGLLLLSRERPFALPPGRDAARAFGNGLDYQVVERWPEVEHAIADYVERWTTRLAARTAPSGPTNCPDPTRRLRWPAPTRNTKPPPRRRPSSPSCMPWTNGRRVSPTPPWPSGPPSPSWSSGRPGTTTTAYRTTPSCAAP